MTPTSQQPISDDQELAKVLAGVNQESNSAVIENNAVTEPPTEEPTQTPLIDEPVTDDTTLPAEDPVVTPVVPPDPTPQPSFGQDDSLDNIKKEALSDLRPLVDKLDVAPEEKFDTFLLLLRSTDDKALIPAAYEAARGIADEARRAQALLDVIKEIDYLSAPKQ